MNPRLVAISGPLKGAVLNLTQDEMTIGRLSGNGVSIPDMALSRRHCAIKREAERFLISDLDSRNGSFVNGIPVKNRPLEHGDQIEIGDSTLLFLLQEGEIQLPSTPVQLDNREVMTATAVPVLVYQYGGKAMVARGFQFDRWLWGLLEQAKAPPEGPPRIQ